MKILLLLGLLLVCDQALSWGSNKDKVLLSKVSSITLERGKMTNGRRSSPVPQLSCVGGTAGCHAFQPRVVQCLNRGSDGYDAQWECKADMDAEYRFGRIQVSCEGYEYPDDPYILRGSCGLEYEIDLTEAGRRSGGGGGGGYNRYDYHGEYQYQGSSFGSKVFQLLVAAAVFYGIYKCFCSGQRRMHQGYSASASSGTGVGGGIGGTGGTGGTGGGFWTGAATGGLLGYLLGGRGGGYGGYGGYGGGYGGGSSWGRGYHRSTGWSSGGGWGSGGGGWGSSGGSSRSSSSSRSTSGFGGTSRR